MSSAQTSSEGAANDSPRGSSTTENEKEPTAPPDGSYDSYECNICLDTVRDAVVSMCGHLFCWPCLHQWLETRPHRQVCPVCKAGISKDKVIPLYGRGSTSQQDPREKLPPRPAGQRSEPENTGGIPGFGFGNNAGGIPGFGFGNNGGFQVSFGIGAFPFGMFASTFNFNNGRPAPPQPITFSMPTFAEDQFLILSRVFLWIAILFIFWLLIA